VDARPDASESNNQVGAVLTSGDSRLSGQVEALRWCWLAAEQGFPAAAEALGLTYEGGEGGPRDEAEALTWLIVAAAQAAGEYRNDVADEMRASFEQRRDSLLDRVSAADRDAGRRRAKGWLEQFKNDRPHDWPLSPDPALP